MIKDFVLFRRMLTPIFLQVIFWLGVAACLVTAIVDFHQKQWVEGLQMLILGPIIVRVACEMLILFFRMNETLTDIKNSLHNKRPDID